MKRVFREKVFAINENGESLKNKKRDDIISLINDYASDDEISKRSSHSLPSESLVIRSNRWSI